MKNELLFAQRISASWRSVTEYLNGVKNWAVPANENGERAAYQQALLVLGRTALESDRRDTFAREGCLALILACIDAGITKRDDIVVRVKRHHLVSYPMIGFMLGEHTGDNPVEHLWFRDDGGAYRLHRNFTPADIGVAA